MIHRGGEPSARARPTSDVVSDRQSHRGADAGRQGPVAFPSRFGAPAYHAGTVSMLSREWFTIRASHAGLQNRARPDWTSFRLASARRR